MTANEFNYHRNAVNLRRKYRSTERRRAFTFEIESQRRSETSGKKRGKLQLNKEKGEPPKIMASGLTTFKNKIYCKLKSENSVKSVAGHENPVFFYWRLKEQMQSV